MVTRNVCISEKNSWIDLIFVVERASLKVNLRKFWLAP